MVSSPVDIEDIEAAAARLAPHLPTLPVLSSRELDERLGARVLLQPENLQRTGSFKIRGALNRLLQLGREQRERGVVAFSSGNHAQAVAAAARLVGTSAVIVMPRDAPAIKLSRTEGWGARVIRYDRYREDREEIAHAVARDEGRLIVPAFDDPHIVAGQGTVGLALAAAARERFGGLDAVVAACSGGGLAAGVGLAVSRYFPSVATYAVEARGFEGVRCSLGAGSRTAAPGNATTICDALMMPVPGKVPWSVMGRIVLRSLAVSDEEVATAMAYAARHLSVVLEPGGAAGLAGLLANPAEFAGQRIGVVLSGGNVDLEVFADCVARG